jgi:hypothetical protein
MGKAGRGECLVTIDGKTVVAYQLMHDKAARRVLVSINGRRVWVARDLVRPIKKPRGGAGD